jgi:hypothetical protein
LEEKLNSIRSTLILFTLLALTMFLTGCAKPPTEEMDNAIAAVTRAENDPDAVAYGGPSIIRAREALANMQTEAGAKRYDAAKTYALEAVNAAERAIADGRAGAQRAREEAAALLSGVRGSLEETEKNLEAAKGVKNIQVDFDALGADFNSAKNMTDQAQTALSQADYQNSINKCQSARSILGDINTTLSQAAIGTSRKK